MSQLRPPAPSNDPPIGISSAELQVECGLWAKSIPEDFRVDELEGVRPSGSGEHLLLSVEKRGIDTARAIGCLARSLEVHPREFGRAGLKDARAVTVQLLSARGADLGRARGLELNGREAGLPEHAQVRVLSAEPHDSKLRPGALRGNRFGLRLRPGRGRRLAPDAIERTGRALGHLGEHGLLNRFGPQRLGPRNRTALAGLALLRGDLNAALERLLGCPLPSDSGQVVAARAACAERGPGASVDLWPGSHGAERRLASRLAKGERPARALRSLPRERVRLHIHAAQSLLFEKLIDVRGGDPTRLLHGDVVRRTQGRGTFRIDDPSAQYPLAAAFEIVPLLPLFGRKLFAAEGPARALELDVLRSFGLDEDTFADRKERGDRRPMRVAVTGVAPPQRVVDGLGDALELGFELPPGSYATTLLAALGTRTGDLTQRLPD